MSLLVKIPDDFFRLFHYRDGFASYLCRLVALLGDELEGLLHLSIGKIGSLKVSRGDFGM